MSKEQSVKLNKDALEASFSQIEYLKAVKRDQILSICKLFDGKISQDDLEEFEKLFRSFCSKETNEMPVSQIGTVLRVLQQVPTENEINKLLETVIPKKNENQDKKTDKKPESKKSDKKSASKNEEEQDEEKIDFYKYLLALGLYLRDPIEIGEEIKKAFKVLDRSKSGYLMSADLRDFLSKLGDSLTDEEIDEMIKLADTENNGQIRYEEFVDLMTNKKPDKKGKKKKGKKKKK